MSWSCICSMILGERRLFVLLILNELLTILMFKISFHHTKGEGGGESGIPSTDLSLVQFCSCPKPRFGFPLAYVFFLFFLFNDLRWEVVVCFCFVDIGGIFYRKCLFFLIIRFCINRSHCIKIYHALALLTSANRHPYQNWQSCTQLFKAYKEDKFFMYIVLHKVIIPVFCSLATSHAIICPVLVSI